MISLRDFYEDYRGLGLNRHYSPTLTGTGQRQHQRQQRLMRNSL